MQFQFICVFFYFLFVCVVCVKLYASFINDSRPHGSTWCRRVKDCDLATGKGHKDFTQSSNRFCVFFDGISIHHMVSCDVPNTARNVAYTSTSTLHDFITSIFAIFYSAALQWWGDSVGRLFAVCELSRSFAHGFGRGLVTRRAIAPTLGRTGTSVKTSTYVTYVLIIPNHILAAVMATICSPWPW